MERKYQITSATNVMKMLVTFNKIGDEPSEPITVPVLVDYFNNRVFYEGEPEHLCGIDLEDLQEEILVYLRPPMLEQPKIPPELLQRIADVRAGKYGADLPEGVL
jgi:hypothetical protein